MPVSGQITSTPFEGASYEDLLKPSTLYTTWFDSIEKDYNKLGEDADLLDVYMQQEPNSKSAEKYRAYQQKLKEGVDSLYKGTNSSTMRNLLNLKRYFNSTIAPIGKAVDTKQKLIEEEKKSKINQHIFGESYADHPIDEFVAGNIPTIRMWNGQEIYKMAKEMGAGFSARMVSSPDLDKSMNPIWMLVKTVGMETGPDGIKNLYLRSKISEDPRQKNIELENVVDGILQSVGFTEKDNGSSNMNKAFDYIFDGLTAGIVYDQSFSTVTNPSALKSSGNGRGRTPKEKTPPPVTRSFNVVPAIVDSEKGKQSKVNAEKMWNHKDENGKYISGNVELIKRIAKENGLNIENDNELRYLIDGSPSLFASTMGVDPKRRPLIDSKRRIIRYSFIMKKADPLTVRNNYVLAGTSASKNAVVDNIKGLITANADEDNKTNVTDKKGNKLTVEKVGEMFKTGNLVLYPDGFKWVNKEGTYSIPADNIIDDPSIVDMIRQYIGYADSNSLNDFEIANNLVEGEGGIFDALNVWANSVFQGQPGTTKDPTGSISGEYYDDDIYYD